jgi:hypothetical protein
VNLRCNVRMHVCVCIFSVSPQRTFMCAYASVHSSVRACLDVCVCACVRVCVCVCVCVQQTTTLRNATRTCTHAHTHTMPHSRLFLPLIPTRVPTKAPASSLPPFGQTALSAAHRCTKPGSRAAAPPPAVETSTPVGVAAAVHPKLSFVPPTAAIPRLCMVWAKRGRHIGAVAKPIPLPPAQTVEKTAAAVHG